MNIDITAVTPTKVTLNGQSMAREYAETLLLPMLVASQGKNYSAVLKVSKAFAAAGLSLKAVPEAAHSYQVHMAEQAQLEARQLAEAQVHAERCRVPTAREIAEKKAERERQAQVIRDHGAMLRSQMGR